MQTITTTAAEFAAHIQDAESADEFLTRYHLDASDELTISREDNSVDVRGGGTFDGGEDCWRAAVAHLAHRAELTTTAEEFVEMANEIPWYRDEDGDEPSDRWDVRPDRGEDIAGSDTGADFVVGFEDGTRARWNNDQREWSVEGRPTIRIGLDARADLSMVYGDLSDEQVADFVVAYRSAARQLGAEKWVDIEVVEVCYNDPEDLAICKEYPGLDVAYGELWQEIHDRSAWAPAADE